MVQNTIQSIVSDRGLSVQVHPYKGRYIVTTKDYKKGVSAHHQHSTTSLPHHHQRQPPPLTTTTTTHYHHQQQQQTPYPDPSPTSFP